MKKRDKEKIKREKQIEEEKKDKEETNSKVGFVSLKPYCGSYFVASLCHSLRGPLTPIAYLTTLKSIININVIALLRYRFNIMQI